MRLSRACYHLALHRFWLTFGRDSWSAALRAAKPETASMAGKVQQMTDELRYYGRQAASTGSGATGKSDNGEDEGAPAAIGVGGAVDEAAAESGSSASAMADAREEDLTTRFRKYGSHMGESFKWRAPSGSRVRGSLASNGARFVMRYPQSFDPDDPAREVAMREAGLVAEAPREGAGLGSAAKGSSAIGEGASGPVDGEDRAAGAVHMAQGLLGSGPAAMAIRPQREDLWQSSMKTLLSPPGRSDDGEGGSGGGLATAAGTVGGQSGSSSSEAAADPSGTAGETQDEDALDRAANAEGAAGAYAGSRQAAEEMEDSQGEDVLAEEEGGADAGSGEARRREGGRIRSVASSLLVLEPAEPRN